MENALKSSLLILSACLLWALDLLVRYPLTLKIGFVHIVFLEALLGIIIVLPWLLTRGRRALKKFSVTDWTLSVFLGGFGMTVAGFLSTASILEASPGTFSFLQIFQPLFVVYAAHVFLKEKMDGLYFYWGLWVILSATLMYSQDLELLLSNDLSMVPGALLIGLATMFIWGLCTIAGKKMLRNHSPMAVLAVRWLFAFVFSCAFLLFEDKSVDLDPILHWDVLWRFAFISGVSGTASMYLYYRGMRGLPAAKISFLELCYPALGIIFSAIYTFERVTLLQTLGLFSFFAFLALLVGRRSNPEKVLGPT